MAVTVCDLISNVHTRFTEADREWLAVLNEEQLEAMVPVVPQVQVIDNKEAKAVTYAELLASAPAEVKAQHDFVANMVKKHRDTLVTAIKANTNNKFTDAQLETMSDDTLQTLSDSIAPVTNYSAGLGSVTITDNAEEPMTLPDHNKKD